MRESTPDRAGLGGLRRIVALLGALGWIQGATPAIAETNHARAALEARVMAVRAVINPPTSADPSQETLPGVAQKAQWSNWPNWGNWNNAWKNWPNWGNWFNR
jgi:hypothetical protein